MRSIALAFAAIFLAGLPASAQEDEIVANLAGGRVIIQVARDGIVFGAIDHPLEAKSVPPRVATIGSSHIGVFFGASEWQVPAQPMPIRLDRNIGDVRPSTQSYQPVGSGDPDLELIGVAFLEKLRPLVSQLHHKFDLKPNEPLFEIVLIGYAKDYGPEVWVIDYSAEQKEVSSRAGDVWQTQILRPRFNQLYPPEKHQPKTLIETRFPDDLQAIPLLGLIQRNDPRLAQLRSSEPRFAKVVEDIEKGQANKAPLDDAVDFMRAALPLLAGNNGHFIEAKIGEGGGFEWIVPPEEPRQPQERAQQGQDKDRPAEAPTLVRKPKPQL